MAHVKTKTLTVTAQFLKKKNKNVEKARQTDDKSRESFSCPKCGQLLVGVEAVRLQSRPKLTKHMQKLLKKREMNEQNLTVRQQELLQRAMQRCNVLVMTCSLCQWKAEIKLESRETLHRRKSRQRQKAEEERRQEHVGGVEDSQPLDKKAQKKLKKKEKRKKVAEAKAEDLQRFKRFSTCSVNGASERCDERPVSSMPMSSTPMSSAPLSSTPLPVESISPFPSGPSSVLGKSVLKTGKPVTRLTPKAARKPDRLTPQLDRSSGHMSGIHRRGSQTPGKQQLRKVLNQQKKDSLSANDSLSQFLNSLT